MGEVVSTMICPPVSFARVTRSRSWRASFVSVERSGVSVRTRVVFARCFICSPMKSSAP